jgi:hypothetical protein
VRAATVDHRRLDVEAHELDRASGGDAIIGGTAVQSAVANRRGRREVVVVREEDCGPLLGQVGGNPRLGEGLCDVVLDVLGIVVGGERVNERAGSETASTPMSEGSACLIRTVPELTIRLIRQDRRGLQIALVACANGLVQLGRSFVLDARPFLDQDSGLIVERGCEPQRLKAAGEQFAHEVVAPLSGAPAPLAVGCGMKRSGFRVEESVADQPWRFGRWTVDTGND